ncbi:MAG: hypothetical protein WDZ49_09260 [Litorilinea sp.]
MPNHMASAEAASHEAETEREVQSSMGRATESGPRHGDVIELRLLVICADREDSNLIAITDILDYMGVPFDVLYAQDEEITQSRLWNGSTAFYQGIIITTANAGKWQPEPSRWEDALDSTEREAVLQCCARFGIRCLVCFCPPGTEIAQQDAARPGYIAEFIDTATTPLALSLTEDGRRVFDYLYGDCTIPVATLATALTPLDNTEETETTDIAGVVATSPAVHPLLTDAGGRIYAAVFINSLGNEQLWLGLNQATELLHTQLLGYGLINWVTRGLFVGHRRIYLSIQVDDIFNHNRLWDAQTQSDAEGETYRLHAEDIEATVQWLRNMRAHPLLESGFTIDMAFNGGGIEQPALQDPLAESLMRHQAHFRWINHGFTHLHLNTANMEECFSEIQQNHLTALNLGLDAYNTDSMVTSDTSGLDNPKFLFAAKSLGVCYLVSDTSRPGWNNPAPNVGNRSRHQPEVLVVPRHPSNLLHDVSTPAEWADRYNHIYRTYWGRDLTIDEILDQEADVILRYLLRFDLDPLMFHQANLRAYDGVHTLLTDLIDRVVAKYATYYGNAPIISLSLHEIGRRMTTRALYKAANVRAALLVNNGLIVTSDRDVTIAITGLHLEGASEVYAGQHISTFSLKAGETCRIPAVNVIVQMGTAPLSGAA